MSLRCNIFLVSFEYLMAYSSLMADINVLKTYTGGTPYNGPYGEAPPKKKTLFRLYVYKRPG